MGKGKKIGYRRQNEERTNGIVARPGATRGGTFVTELCSENDKLNSNQESCRSGPGNNGRMGKNRGQRSEVVEQRSEVGDRRS